MLFVDLYAMTSLIGENADQLRAIARPRRVRRLGVFGSAVTDDFDAARSDIDMVVEIGVRNARTGPRRPREDSDHAYDPQCARQLWRSAARCSCGTQQRRFTQVNP